MGVSNSFVFVERRGESRRRANQRATIHVDGSARGCLIRDRSPGGARIEMSADFPLPLRFELQLGNASPIPVQVIWQEGQVAGLRFNSRPLWQKLLNPVAWLPRAQNFRREGFRLGSRRKGGG